MDNKAKIILSRSSQWMNRFRSYQVLINGKQVGLIKNGGSEEFTVDAGNTSVECKLAWYGSRPFSMTLKDGETAYLRVKSGMKWYLPLVLIMAVGVGLIFYYRGNPDKPAWVSTVSLVCIIPALLYSLYYLFFGRKDYLVLEKDTNNIFA